eukprot:3373224-Prymnesium_polylepis.1
MSFRKGGRRNPCHMSGERSPKPTTSPPGRGETGVLSWPVVLCCGFPRLFEALHGGAGRRRTSVEVTPPKRVSVSAEAGEGAAQPIRPTRPIRST